MSGSEQNSTEPQAFQTVGSQVQHMDGSIDETNQKVVEEIESFCVNCEKNVSFASPYPSLIFANEVSGHHQTTPNQDSIFSRDHPNGF